jgi:hypothetical protein
MTQVKPRGGGEHEGTGERENLNPLGDRRRLVREERKYSDLVKSCPKLDGETTWWDI